MAKLKIKEGSLILELWQDAPAGSGTNSRCIWSHTFEDLDYEGLEVEAHERAENPERWRNGKLDRVQGHHLTVKKRT